MPAKAFIANSKTDAKIIKIALKSIKERFGEDYLDKLEARIGDMKNEIIIAIENVKE